MGALINADVDSAYVFADKAQQQHDHAADKKHTGQKAGIAHGNFRTHQFLVNHETACNDADDGADKTDECCYAKGLYAKGCETVNPKTNEACDGVAGGAFQTAAVLHLNIAQILGGAEYQAADVGEGVVVADNFFDDEFSHDEETGGLQSLGLADNSFCHFLVGPATESAEQMLLFVGVIAVHHIKAFFQLVYQLEGFAGGSLAVVIQAYHVIAGGLAVASHQGAVLAEILGEANAFDFGVGCGQILDDVPDPIGAAVVDQDDFVIVARRSRVVARDDRRTCGTVLRGDCVADFVDYGFNGSLASIAGNDKGNQCGVILLAHNVECSKSNL